MVGLGSTLKSGSPLSVLRTGVTMSQSPMVSWPIFLGRGSFADDMPEDSNSRSWSMSINRSVLFLISQLLFLSLPESLKAVLVLESRMSFSLADVGSFLWV